MPASTSSAPTIFDAEPGFVSVLPPPVAPVEPERRTPGEAAGLSTVTKIRVVAATAVRTVCTMAASVLVLSALVLLAGADDTNALVRFVVDTADRVDLSVFDLDNGMLTFTGDRADLKDALFNRGLAAIVWLLAGRTLSRAVDPAT